MRSFLSFASVGTLGFLVDAGVLFGLLPYFGPYLARFGSFLVAILVTWRLNRLFTFKSRQDGWAEFKRYFVSQSVGAGLNYAVYALAIFTFESMARWPLAALGLGSVAGLAVNFVMAKRYVFKGGSMSEREINTQPMSFLEPLVLFVGQENVIRLVSWQKSICKPCVAVLMVTIAYFVGYVSHRYAPGNDSQYPLGWWGWFDQGKYLLAVNSIAQLDFSPEKYFYPPLYPMLGSLFVPWLDKHPFLLINFVCLLWFCAVFIWLASRYISRWGAVALLLVSVLANYRIFEHFLIPWTSTLCTALLSVGIYGMLKLRDNPNRPAALVPAPSVVASFGISLAIGLIAALRPADAVVGGVLWLGYMGRIIQLLRASGTAWLAPFSRIFAGSAVGILIGPALFIGFNYLVFGSILGSYIQVNAANGFFPADLAEKFVSLFLDGYSLYLEPKSGLIDHYPWLALSLIGLVFVILCGDWVLRTIALAMCVQFVLYLPYGDLLPNGLWRYFNIHYFKWMFPYLALFAWSLVAFLVRQWNASKKSFATQFGIVSVSLVLLLSFRAQVDFRPVNLSVNSAPDTEGQALSWELGNTVTDLIDITGLQGGFTDVYFGEHELWADGHELRRVRDFRVLPAPWGVRVLFNRPLTAQSVKFRPDVRLSRAASGLRADVGIYGFGLGVPKPFWNEQDALPIPIYKLGQIVDFSAQGNSPLYSREGWSNPEPWGRWTVGRKARLRLRLDSPQTKPLLLRLNMNAFVNEKHSEQKVDIALNGNVLRHLVLHAGHDDKPQEAVVEIPANVLGDKGQLDFLFATPDSMSPKKLGISGDSRTLGVGIVSFQLTE